MPSRDAQKMARTMKTVAESKEKGCINRGGECLASGRDREGDEGRFEGGRNGVRVWVRKVDAISN